MSMKPRLFVRLFKSQFAPLVEAGTKRQTVRPFPYRMPRIGDLISLRAWTGRAYNSPQRILRESTITRVADITIYADQGALEIDDRALTSQEREAFAIADGFESFQAMCHWFGKEGNLNHIGLFRGIVIFWD